MTEPVLIQVENYGFDKGDVEIVQRFGITEGDVHLIELQTDVSRDMAVAALFDAKGDLVDAILVMIFFSIFNKTTNRRK